MKARVKATGEIGIVSQIDLLLNDDFISFSPNNVELMTNYVDNSDKTLYDELDDVYWANMKHQYAGMAMQGLLNNSLLAGELKKDPNNGIAEMSNTITKAAVIYATALVEKLKSESDEK